MWTGGEFSFTGDVRSTNSNLVNSNDAALYAFAHCHIHVILTVCCTLVLFKKNMIPNVHKLPRILSALLVTVLFTSYLITFVLIIYLFVKMLCLLKYKYVYFTLFLFLIHFQIISILNMN